MKHESKSGFTLVEVVMATSILAIGLLAIGWTLITAGQMGKVSRNRMHAINHARAELERLHQLNFNHEDLDTGLSHSISTNGYTGSYTVTQPESEIKWIRMRIDYVSYFDNLRELELRGAMSDVLH